MLRLVAFVGIVGTLALAAALLGYAPSVAELRDFGASLGWAGYLLWTPVTAVLNSAFVPGPVLAGAAGVLFGTVAGTPLAIVAATASACLQMAIGRFVAGNEMRDRLPDRVRRIDRFLERRGFWAVLYIRLAPAIPFTLVNYGAGLTRLRFRDMAAGTALGAAPRTFAYVALGGSLRDLSSPQAIAAASFLVVISIAGLVIGRREIRADRSS